MSGALISVWISEVMLICSSVMAASRSSSLSFLVAVILFSLIGHAYADFACFFGEKFGCKIYCRAKDCWLSSCETGSCECGGCGIVASSNCCDDFPSNNNIDIRDEDEEEENDDE